jgi:hypothetical protein
VRFGVATETPVSSATSFHDKVQKLSAVVTQSDGPPQLSTSEAMACRREIDKLFEHGTMVEKKQLLRTYVEQIRLTPERLQIEVTYRVPEHFMNHMVAGAGFEPATFGL